MMSRKLLLILVILSMTISFAHLSFADESQRDVISTPGLNRTVPSQNRKKEVKEWFESMGLDTTGDGLAQNMYHLMAGIEEQLSPTSNFSVSAGTGLHMGVTF